MPTQTDEILAMFRELDRLEPVHAEAVRIKDERFSDYEVARMKLRTINGRIQAIRLKIIELEKQG